MTLKIHMFMLIEGIVLTLPLSTLTTTCLSLEGTYSNYYLVYMFVLRGVQNCPKK